MPMSLADIVATLPSDESWGPSTTTDALVDGVPYAPYSKGDKLGRMADWTTEGKDREGRGGRQQYNRNYKGHLQDILDLKLPTATDFEYRSASIRCWHLFTFRRASCRGRILVLCRRQYSYIDQESRIWSWRSHIHPGPRPRRSRSTRRSGHFSTCWPEGWPTEWLLRQSWWTRRSWRSPLWRLERLRQTTTQSRLLRKHQAGLADARRDRL